MRLCDVLVCFTEDNGIISCKYFPRAVLLVSMSCPICGNELSVVVGAK